MSQTNRSVPLNELMLVSDIVTATGRSRVAVYNMIERGRLVPAWVFDNGIMLFLKTELENFEWPKPGRPKKS